MWHRSAPRQWCLQIQEGRQTKASEMWAPKSPCFGFVVEVSCLGYVVGRGCGFLPFLVLCSVPLCEPIPSLSVSLSCTQVTELQTHPSYPKYQEETRVPTTQTCELLTHFCVRCWPPLSILCRMNWNLPWKTLFLSAGGLPLPGSWGWGSPRVQPLCKRSTLGLASLWSGTAQGDSDRHGSFSEKRRLFWGWGHLRVPCIPARMRALENKRRCFPKPWAMDFWSAAFTPSHKRFMFDLGSASRGYFQAVVLGLSQAQAFPWHKQH